MLTRNSKFCCHANSQTIESELRGFRLIRHCAIMAKLHYTNKLANKFVSGALINYTEPTYWALARPGPNTLGSCLVRAQQVSQQVGSVYQTRTCWQTSCQLVGQLDRVVEFGHNGASRTISRCIFIA
jgi:hypothetical protein